MICHKSLSFFNIRLTLFALTLTLTHSSQLSTLIHRLTLWFRFRRSFAANSAVAAAAPTSPPASIDYSLVLSRSLGTAQVHVCIWVPSRFARSLKVMMLVRRCQNGSQRADLGEAMCKQSASRDVSALKIDETSV
jgi:hypothetical protein